MIYLETDRQTDLPATRAEYPSLISSPMMGEEILLLFSCKHILLLWLCYSSTTTHGNADEGRCWLPLLQVEVGSCPPPPIYITRNCSRRRRWSTTTGEVCALVQKKISSSSSYMMICCDEQTHSILRQRRMKKKKKILWSIRRRRKGELLPFIVPSSCAAFHSWMGPSWTSSLAVSSFLHIQSASCRFTLLECGRRVWKLSSSVSIRPPRTLIV